jgi:hypothetical protein
LPKPETKNLPTPNNSIEKSRKPLDQWCETNGNTSDTKTPESDATTIPETDPRPSDHLYESLKALYSEAKGQLATKDHESETLTQDFQNVKEQFGSALAVIEDLNAKNQSLSERVGSIENNLE